MPNLSSVFKILIVTIAVAVCWSAQPAFAGIYKWTDDAGKTHFTDDKSKIPKKYRTKTGIKKLRQLDDRTFDPSKAGKSGAENGPGEAKEEGILSDQEVNTANETIAFFDSENARSAKYKGLQNVSPTYRSMQLEIQKNLPQKQKLIDDLAKSKSPAFKESHQFLKKSEAADKSRLKAVWQSGYIGGFFGRIISEIEIKNALKEKLQAALEESKENKEKKLKEEKEKEEKEKAEKEKESKKTKQAKE